MRAPSVALLVSVFLLVGCAEGGPSGTGISAVSGISGQVTAVDLPAGDSGARRGIAVAVVGSQDLTTSTDDNGNFDLSGNLPREVTLRFATPSYTSDIAIEVPSEATVILQQITLQIGTPRLPPPRVIRFVGEVAFVDCRDATILVKDRNPANQPFTVRISSDTLFTDSHGGARQCADVEVGKPVQIQGTQDLSNHRMDATAIVVAPTPAIGPPPPTEDIAFIGSVALVDCASGSLSLDDRAMTEIRLTPRTDIFTAQHQTRTCADIQPGIHAQGAAVINVRQPGPLEAKFIVIGPAPPPPSPGLPPPTPNGSRPPR